MLNKRKLPNTTTFWKENGIFFIKHTSFRVTMEEAKEIGELLKEAYLSKDTNAIVIDNYEAKGAWAQDVNQIWVDVATAVGGKSIKKVATITSDVISKMQINRLSKMNGSEMISRAFNSEFNEEVKQFLDSK